MNWSTFAGVLLFGSLMWGAGYITARWGEGRREAKKEDREWDRAAARADALHAAGMPYSEAVAVAEGERLMRELR